jgi:hypothetical protein
MKHALVLVPLAMVAAGCSPMVYQGYRPTMPGTYAPAAFAQPPLPVGRWDNVMRLAAASMIDVLTLDGTANVGPFVWADAQSLVIQRNGGDVRIPRTDIIRVDVVDAPGSEAKAVARNTLRGALLGAGASVLVSAVIGGPAWPPPGAWLRAGAAAGGVAGAQGALGARQPRMVYLAPSQAPSVYPYAPPNPSRQPVRQPLAGTGLRAPAVQVR